MAAISVTSTEVVAGTTGATFSTYVAGEVITAGQAIYIKSSDGKAYLADCDASTATAACIGIAVNGAQVAGQKVTVQTGGTVTIGASASITSGMCVYLSPTAGAITATEADILTGDYLTFIGIGNASNAIVLRPWYSGVAHA